MQRRQLIATTVASAVFPSLVWSQALEKPQLSIAVGGKNLFYYLPLTIAEQLGYFKAEGLDVTIVDFSGGARALQAVVGGSADVVSGAFEHTVNMHYKGQPMRAFVVQGAAPQITLGYNPKTMPNYKSVADLKGKKIGVTVIGLEVPHEHIHLIPIDLLSDMDFSKPKLKLEESRLLEVAKLISEAV